MLNGIVSRSLRVAMFLTLFALFSFDAGAQQDSAGTRLLRYPDVHGDRAVFTYAGDLWVAARAGGQARRLTSHPGEESFPKFSPDGKWIAFTGDYDGNTDTSSPSMAASPAA
jgi:tricorn protease